MTVRLDSLEHRDQHAGESDDPRSPAAIAYTNLIFEVMRLHGRLIANGEKLTKDLGLTTARWQVLGSVFRDGPMTVAEIARNIGLQRQGVQRIINELVRLRHVELKQNPRHSRAKLVHLMPVARAKIKRLRKRQALSSNRITSKMLEEEISRVVLFLRGIREQLENEELV